MDWGLLNKAVRRIPRVDKAQWDGLDVFSRWLIVTRAAVLIITFIPCALAGLLAYRNGAFDSWLWCCVTVGLLLAHATNNILNDIIDHRKGVDKGNYFRAQYGAHPLEHGFMTIRQALAYAAVTGGAALAVGAYLIYLRGGLALGLTVVGAFFVLFYTWPLKYIGLGEVAVLAVWGPLMTGGAYFIITGAWDWAIALWSLPYAIGATTVLFGKHIDKLADDKAKGIRTLPVLLGEPTARAATLALMASQYVLVAVLVLTKMASPFLLIALVGLTTARPITMVFRTPRPTERPDFVPEDIWPLYFVAAAFYHSRKFGVYFLLGLLADVALRAAGVIA
ncbi:MAG TPA: prenyltransferase [Candidatus Hydrogenedentes bacterium]|nr:prenyltransferase [Candidatus Hydrogenedentota bacterium]HPG69904.1 prenyltransferase [Candidatus Hydrogenedentota bacterium]